MAKRSSKTDSRPSYDELVKALKMAERALRSGVTRRDPVALALAANKLSELLEKAS